MRDYAVTHSLTNLHILKLLFFRLILATQGLGMMLPNIAELLPDVDSTIQCGVLQRIVDVSIQSFNVSFSFFSCHLMLMSSRCCFALCIGCGRRDWSRSAC